MHSDDLNVSRSFASALAAQTWDHHVPDSGGHDQHHGVQALVAALERRAATEQTG